MRSSAASDLAEADARGGTSDLVNDDRSRRADAAVERAPRRGSAASWAPPLVVVGATLAAYLPVVIIPYAFEDDYWILGATHGLGGRPVWQTASAGGRPLQGLLLMGIFSVVPDIDSLRLVRLVSVVGVALLGVLVYAALRRSGISRWLATAAALSVVTLPSFQVYASWAVLFEAPYAAILAGLAWLCASSALGSERRALLVRAALAVGLLFTALLIYQPAAMFFWVFAAIDVLPRNARLVGRAKTFVLGLAVAVVALAGAYVVTKVAVQHYGAPGGGRSTLTHDVVGKVRWFWDQPLPNALNLFNLVPKWTIAGVTIAVATLGILLLHARRRWDALGFLAIGFVLVPLSYLPNLVVVEDWPSYRSLGALTALLMLYVWFGLLGLARAARLVFRRSRPTTPAARNVARALTAAIALTGLVVAARNVTTLFAKPQSIEHQMLRAALATRRLSGVQRIVFIKPDGSQSAAPLVRYDEFGLPSSYAPWVPDPAVKLVLREHGHPDNAALQVLAWDQAAGVHAGPHRLVLDMRKLREHRVGWTFWSLRAGTAR